MASLDDLTVRITVTSNLITMTGKYQTRDGRAVRILCVDGPDCAFPIVGFIGDRTTTDKWTRDGRWELPCGVGWNENQQDLVPVPTKHESWCVINRGGSMARLATLYASEDVANACKGDYGFVAHVTWES